MIVKNEISHLSSSQINQFLKCQLQWKFRKLDNLVIPPGAALLKGSAVHKGLEYIYTEKKAFKSYYKDIAQDKANEYINKAEVDLNTSKNDLKDSSTKLLEVYCEEKYPEQIRDENIQGVEHEIRFKIKDIEIIGYIDLLEYDEITDFKTTGRKPAGIDLSYKIQAGVYSKATGIKEINMQYLIDKKSPEIVNLSHKATNETFITDLIVNVHTSMRNAIKSGDFMPNGLSSQWACNYCGYGEQGICKYYKLKG